jgi:hypothetical protein
MNSGESEPLREATRADLNPVLKAYLHNALVPAMVQRWIEENGGKTATTPLSEMTVKS